jgi:hypothetical protein
MKSRRTKLGTVPPKDESSFCTLFQNLTNLSPSPLSDPGLVRYHQHELLEVVRDQGLSPLVYRNLRALGLISALDPEPARVLKEAYTHTLALNMELLACLREVGESAKKEDIDLICLKGPALIATVYGDPGVRPMDDIDLMVHPGKIDQLKATLSRLGYSPVCLYPDLFRRGRVVFDLHIDPINQTRIPSRARSIHLDLDELWKCAVPLQGYPHLEMLNEHDQVITLCIHAVKHGFQQTFWLVDIAEAVLRLKTAEEWTSLKRKAIKIGVLDSLVLCLYYIKVRLYRKLPQYLDELAEWFAPGPLLQRVIQVASTPGMPQLIEPYMMLKNTPGLAIKIRYILEAAFPKGDVLLQVTGISHSPSRWARFPIRAAQLAGMTVKYSLNLARAADRSTQLHTQSADLQD